MLFAAFRRWLASWKEALARREATRRGQRRDAGRPRKTQLELEPLERRWVPNDILGRLQGGLAGLGLAWLGSELIAGLRDPAARAVGAATTLDSVRRGAARPAPLATLGGQLKGLDRADAPAPGGVARPGAKSEEAASGSAWPAWAQQLFTDLTADPDGSTDGHSTVLSDAAAEVGNGASGGSGGLGGTGERRPETPAPSRLSPISANDDSSLLLPPSTLSSTPTRPSSSSTARPAGSSTSSPRTVTLVSPGATRSQETRSLPPLAARAALADVPLYFEPNVGQAEAGVQFLARTGGYDLALTAEGAVLTLRRPAPKEESSETRPGARRAEAFLQEPAAPNYLEEIITMQYVGARADAQVVGRDLVPGVSNYYLGVTADSWFTDVRHYGQAVYRDLYPGVDLVFHSNAQKQVEYDFVLAPGANPDTIRLSFGGATPELDEQGNLVLETAGGDLVQAVPVLYQEAGGQRQVVSGTFVLDGDEVGFQVGNYDASRALVIDPAFSYASYVPEAVSGLAVDNAGFLYLSGTSGFGFTADAVVSKYNPATSQLVYRTVLGGSGFDGAQDIAVDAAGHAYVAGVTASGDLPLQNAFQTERKGVSDVFVAGLNAAGGLIYSTYLGGSGNENTQSFSDIAVAPSGMAVITGDTTSSDFPTTAGAFKSTHDNGISDAFVTQLSPAGGLVYSSYLGGSAQERGYGVAISPDGLICVVGATWSGDFPTGDIPNPYLYDLYTPFARAFVVTFSTLSSPPEVTLLGDGEVGGIAAVDVVLDADHNAYITGETGDQVLDGPFLGESGYLHYYVAFAAKIGPGGGVIYSARLGGDTYDAADGIARDAAGNIYLTGRTYSANFPTDNGFQTANAGAYDAFITKINPTLTALEYSSYLGGGGGDRGYGVVVSALGEVYVAGDTDSTNFPALGYQSGYAGFVAHITFRPSPPIITAISTDTGAFADDFITSDTTLTLSGTAEAGSTVALYRAGVGLLGTTTASGGGLWTYTYATTLPEGTHAFSARATLGGFASELSPTRLVTVDTTAPTVTLTTATLTYDTTPEVLVTAFDLVGVDAAATVTLDVDLNNDNDFDDGGETDYQTTTLSNGFALFEVDPALALSTVKMRARVLDLAGNEGTSSNVAVTVASTPPGIKGPGRTPNISVRAGDPLLYAGKVRIDQRFILDANGCGCYSGGAVLSYDSGSVSVQPILQAIVQTDSVEAMAANVIATLTWDGSVVASHVFPISGFTPGDVITLAMQVPTPVTDMGRYAWSLDITLDYPTPFQDSVGGAVYLAPRDDSPYGAGWSFGHLDRLYPLAADVPNGLPAGLMRAYGAGEADFYEDVGGGDYTGPGEDKGTLIASGGGYIYTDPKGNQTLFNGDGMQTGWQSADGESLFTFTYIDADSDGDVDDLETQTNRDSSVATFTYDAGKLASIAAPGRTVELGYDGDDLAVITNPDGSLHTFTYDDHRVTSEEVGTQTNSWAYANGLATSLTRGDAPPTTLTPALSRGLGELAKGDPWAEVTDPLGHTMRATFDDQGRPLSSLSPLGGQSQTTRDGNGFVTGQTDALGRSTGLTPDAFGFITQVTNPDSTTRTYEYQDDFHALTTVTDERGQTTVNTYNGQGQLIRVTDPQGNIASYTYENGLLKTITDPLLNTITYDYDEFGRVKTVTDPGGGVMTFSYDAAGNVRTVTDPLNQTTTYSHDGMGRVTGVEQPGGGLWTTVYDAVGRVVETVDPLGRRTLQEYDARGLLTRSVSAVDTAQEQSRLYEYDDAGRLVATRDAQGNWSFTEYDAAGRVIKTTDALGHKRQSIYDLAGQLVASRDELGRQTTYAYDDRGFLISTTDPLGNETTFTYDEVGHQLSSTDALGNTWATEYDELGRAIVSITPLGFRTTTAYDEAGRVFSVVDAREIETRYEYDELGRRVRTIEAYGTGLERTLTSVYDDTGNVLARTDGLDHTYTYGYDELNRRVTVTDPLGHTVTTAYDAVGNVKTVTDALEQVVTYGYDALNRQVSTTDPLGHTNTIVYDAQGRVVASIDALGHVQQIGYDALGRVVVEIDALGGVTRWRYDDLGNLISLTDPVGNETTWEFDALNREVKMTDPAGESATMAYDAAGRLESVTDRLGRRKDYFYDEDSRQTRETWVASGGGTVNRATFTYDEVGHTLTAADAAGTITFDYDELGRVETQTDVWGKTLTFSYDAADRRTLVEDPFGGVLTSVYDEANRLESRQFGGAGQTPLRFDLTYNERHEMTELTRFGNLVGTMVIGTSVYDHDEAGRLRSIDHKNGSNTVLASYTYDYDEADRLTEETIDGSLRTYSYDHTNQLTNDNGTGYSYDANGNRTMAGYETDVANRMSNDGTYTYTYDKAGNTIKKSKGVGDETWTFAYDHLNHLVGIEERATDGGTLLLKVTYTYDVFGQRIQMAKWKTGVGTTTERYAYDGGQVWADLDGSSALTMRRIFGDNVDELFARISAGGTAALYWTDHLGSVVGIVDGSGSPIDRILYAAYGKVLNETSPANGDRYAWTARERDGDTGLQYNRARYYDVEVGRWLSEDPKGFNAGDVNLGRYVGNNPTNATDPSGLDIVYNFLLEELKGVIHEHVPSLLFVPSVSGEISIQSIKFAAMPADKYIPLVEGGDRDARKEWPAAKLLANGLLAVGKPKLSVIRNVDIPKGLKGVRALPPLTLTIPAALTIPVPWPIAAPKSIILTHVEFDLFIRIESIVPVPITFPPLFGEMRSSGPPDVPPPPPECYDMSYQE